MKPITLPGIDDYAEKHTTAVPADVVGVVEEHLGKGFMMSGQLVGGLLRMLVHALRPQFVLEIGTFVGYSALAMASALPAGARLVTCEIDPERAAVAGKHIAASPFADRISLRVGPAAETIDSLSGPFDLIFIDGDLDYYGYIEATLPKLSPHGLIVCDNTLWQGKVLDPADSDDITRAIGEFNDAVAADPRLECVLLPIRDGVTIIRAAQPV
jgi:caffeoyl-CoA O-methyltransferase